MFRSIPLKHWLTLVPETRGAQRLPVGTLRSMATAITEEAKALTRELADAGIHHPVLASRHRQARRSILRIAEKAA